MEAREQPPALEAGLRPVAVGSADVDRAELAQNQQHIIEMLGRRVVGVDQQGDVGFLLGVAIAHYDSFFASLARRRGMTTAWRGSC